MPYVISLGGSIIAPDKVDKKYLNDFIQLIKHRTDEGDKFFIITGGGALAREYQQIAKKLARVSDVNLDWLGIAATRVHAELLKSVFAQTAEDQVQTDPNEQVNTEKQIVLYQGEKPGQSTDTVAVRVALANDVTKIINLSNVSHVYSADPGKDKNAEQIETMTWDEFLKMFGSDWQAGANYPFDPVAAKLAKENNLEVVVTDGTDLDNLENILLGNEFEGTVIK